ncbi:unnamed protein product, partial [Amoebophrya sp. A25]
GHKHKITAAPVVGAALRPRGGQLLWNHQMGLNWWRYRHEGIAQWDFGERFASLTKNITWVSFDGFRDFAFLTRMMTRKPLPTSASEYLRTLNQVLPHRVDIKQSLLDTSMRRCGILDR